MEAPGVHAELVTSTEADGPYWEFESDDESGLHRRRDGLPQFEEVMDHAAKQDRSISSLAEELRWGALLWEFTKAVVPLSAFVVLYIGIILERWIFSWQIAMGLTNVIAGLAIFKFGLMSGLMPFGESIGMRLPEKAPLPVVFAISLLLGVLVTYSEPGINSLQLVGEILNKQTGGDTAPLLMEILSPQRSFHLLTAVACGVGIASACGLLRLQYRCGMKPFIYCCITPLLVLTWYCWQSPELADLVGLCWDCGAITTGPATVPIVLSMGIGVARTARQSRRSVETCCSTSSSSEVDGFGIVTLASLVPVFTVMVFGLLCSFFGDSAALDEGQVPPAASAHIPQVDELDRGVWEEFPLKQLWQSCRAVGPLVTFLVLVQGLLIQEPPAGTQPWTLVKGFTATFIGLFVFNIGLAYGSIPLGEAAGQKIPAALTSGTIFSHEAGTSGFLGEFIVMLFGFVAGFMATVIDLEPCGLGETVERLSGGKFTKRDLILSVASGVGLGIALGFAKVLYNLDLLLVLCAGYAVALILTVFADEGLCCIAWDSAGVTTGPVTVPLVLSMGVGICSEVGSVDGFGILACASVCPIISVLIASMLRSTVCKHRARKESIQMAEELG